MSNITGSALSHKNLFETVSMPQIKNLLGMTSGLRAYLALAEQSILQSGG
jgi:hypothetical protein